MSNTQKRTDEKLIWSISSGSTLRCTRSMIMESNGDIAFEAGQLYRVSSMHPLADPPYIKVIDEQGCGHRLEANDVRNYFYMETGKTHEH